MTAGSQFTFTKRYVLNNSYDDIVINVKALTYLNPSDPTNISVTYSLESLMGY